MVTPGTRPYSHGPWPPAPQTLPKRPAGPGRTGVGVAVGAGVAVGVGVGVIGSVGESWQAAIVTRTAEQIRKALTVAFILHESEL
jgi:hypothetical protein